MPFFGLPAQREALAAAIVASNDATVAGATLTSNRIMSADALRLKETAK